MCERAFLRLLCLVTWLSAALSCLQLLLINLHTFPLSRLNAYKKRKKNKKRKEKLDVNDLLRKMLTWTNNSLHKTLKASPVGRCARRSAVNIKYPILSLCILPRKLRSPPRNPSGSRSCSDSPQQTIPGLLLLLNRHLSGTSFKPWGESRAERPPRQTTFPLSCPANLPLPHPACCRWHH